MKDSTYNTLMTIGFGFLSGVFVSTAYRHFAQGEYGIGVAAALMAALDAYLAITSASRLERHLSHGQVPRS